MHNQSSEICGTTPCGLHASSLHLGHGRGAVVYGTAVFFIRITTHGNTVDRQLKPSRSCSLLPPRSTLRSWTHWHGWRVLNRILPVPWLPHVAVCWHHGRCQATEIGWKTANAAWNFTRAQCQGTHAFWAASLVRRGLLLASSLCNTCEQGCVGKFVSRQRKCCARST